ncbi:IS200/IS605 family transposase, partial [Pseudoflavonifractor phocaeensis]|nr:IS200/IS605 family transposase [Pseudoflavonifractor phocaeensis]
CRGYYVDTTGKSTQRIATYIQNQLKEDQISDQMTMKEYENPFTGRK